MTDTLIDSVLEMEDDAVFVEELAYSEFEHILKNISNDPMNCSETGFQNSQQGACCCYNDTTPQTFGTCV